jgi:microcompartment protein CcmK/EutM
MTLARVVGTVVATLRADAVPGARFLLVEECTQKGEGKGELLVALDAVGADRGHVVLVAQGSSCRWTRLTDDRPIDALVIGIVDQIDEGGSLAYGMKEWQDSPKTSA